jgi:hypothetical protein
MNREEAHKLLGGYGTGTLTPEEQQALFAAALEDQELFDALAREQALRDLLRDPAAKAEVLAALDAARHTALDTVRVPWYRHGWLPAAVAAAICGIAVMAVVVTRKHAPPPQAMTVAELKAPAQGVAQTAGPGAGGQGPGAEPDAPVARRAKPLTLPKQEHSAAAPRDLPAPAAATPRFSAVSADSAPVRARQMPMPQAGQQLGLGYTATGSAGALESRFLAPNARLLFYGNPVAAGEMVKFEAAEKTPAPEPARARAANSAGTTATLTVVPAFHLGVRCSILRQQTGGETAEVGIETVLDAGEQVKLKLVPNQRGYLRVWEPGPNGTLRSIASGTAQPLQPFEASLPDYPSAGARQLYVQFTRDGQAAIAVAVPQSSLWTLAPANLIQTVADAPEKATYVVDRFSDPATQQVLVPITLNYK